MHRRMLAVAFGPPNMRAALDGLPRIREQADCVELRLDLFEEPFDLPTLLRERGELPVVATLRPPGQGGKSGLAPEERLKVLLRAAELGAEYVDLEFDVASPAALSAVRAAGARVIVSRHDLSRMPGDLAEWWAELAALGGDVIKVAGTAHNVCDGLPILHALARADRPTIAIAIGQAGLLTRVLALRNGECFLTYAALDEGGGTAPGQLTAREMRETYGVRRLGPRTRVYGLLGPHSDAARLEEYNRWFTEDGWDGVAVPFLASADASKIVSAFRELPVDGWHVHGANLQSDVLHAVDEATPKAAAQGRANGLVRRTDGALVGHWVESPREQYELWLHSAG
jgi:3-dehydroquinate dehydratase/shikimate dehydrogenase